LFDLFLAEAEALERRFPALAGPHSPTSVVGAAAAVAENDASVGLAGVEALASAGKSKAKAVRASKLAAAAATAVAPTPLAFPSLGASAGAAQRVRHRSPMLSITSTFDPAAVVRFLKSTARAHWRPLLVTRTLKDSAHPVTLRPPRARGEEPALEALQCGPLDPAAAAAAAAVSPAAGTFGASESSSIAAAPRRVNKTFNARHAAVPLYRPYLPSAASTEDGDWRAPRGTPTEGLLMPAPVSQPRSSALLGQWAYLHLDALRSVDGESASVPTEGADAARAGLRVLPHSLATARVAALALAALPPPAATYAPATGARTSATDTAAAAARMLFVDLLGLGDRFASEDVALLAARAHALLPWVSALARLRYSRARALPDALGDASVDAALALARGRRFVADAEALVAEEVAADTAAAAAGAAVGPDASYELVFPPSVHTLELKYDGMAVALSFAGGALATAATRGNGAIGANITQKFERICSSAPTVFHSDSTGAAALNAGASPATAEGRAKTRKAPSSKAAQAVPAAAAAAAANAEAAGAGVDPAPRELSPLHRVLCAALRSELAPAQVALARTLATARATAACAESLGQKQADAPVWADVSGHDLWATLPTGEQAEVALASRLWAQRSAQWAPLVGAATADAQAAEDPAVATATADDGWASHLGLLAAPLEEAEFAELVAALAPAGATGAGAGAGAGADTELLRPAIFAGSFDVRGELLLHQREFARMNARIAALNEARVEAAAAAAADEGAATRGTGKKKGGKQCAAVPVPSLTPQFTSPRNLIVGILGRDEDEEPESASAAATAAALAERASQILALNTAKDAAAAAASKDVGVASDDASIGDIVNPDPMSEDARTVYMAYALLLREDAALSPAAVGALEASVLARPGTLDSATLLPAAARAVAAATDAAVIAAAAGARPGADVGVAASELFHRTDALFSPVPAANVSIAAGTTTAACAEMGELAALARAAAALLPHHTRLSLLRALGFATDPYALTIALPAAVPSEDSADTNARAGTDVGAVRCVASEGPDSVLEWPELDSAEEISVYTPATATAVRGSAKAAAASSKAQQALRSAVGEYVSSLASASVTFAGAARVHWEQFAVGDGANAAAAAVSARSAATVSARAQGMQALADSVNRALSPAHVRTALGRRVAPLPDAAAISSSDATTLPPAGAVHPLSPFFQLATALLHGARRRLPLHTDGLVLKVSDSAATASLGAASRTTRSAIAVKAPAGAAAVDVDGVSAADMAAAAMGSDSHADGSDADTGLGSSASDTEEAVVAGPAKTAAKAKRGTKAAKTTVAVTDDGAPAAAVADAAGSSALSSDDDGELARLFAGATGGHAAVTRLAGVAVQIGRSGKATPVALLDPVPLNGATVARATLHHHSALLDPASPLAGLRLGDRVVIERRGDIIPMVRARLPDHLQDGAGMEGGNSGDGEDLLPRSPCGSFVCPCALRTPLARRPLLKTAAATAKGKGRGGKRGTAAAAAASDSEAAFAPVTVRAASTADAAVETAGGELVLYSAEPVAGWSASLYCVDTLQCPEQALRRLAHFASKTALDIEGVSEKTLAQLRDAGLLHCSLPGLAALALDSATRHALCTALAVPLPDGELDHTRTNAGAEWLPHDDLAVPAAPAAELIAAYDAAYVPLAAAAAAEPYRLPGGADYGGPHDSDSTGIDGWKVRKAHKLILTIAASLAEQPLSRVIVGLGVPSLGPSSVDLLLAHFNDDVCALFAASAEDIAQIKGIGGVDDGAGAIARGLAAALERDVMPLAKLGVPTLAPLLRTQQHKAGCSAPATAAVEATAAPALPAARAKASKKSSAAGAGEDADDDAGATSAGSVARDAAAAFSSVYGSRFAVTGSICCSRADIARYVARRIGEIVDEAHAGGEAAGLVSLIGARAVQSTAFLGAALKQIKVRVRAEVFAALAAGKAPEGGFAPDEPAELAALPSYVNDKVEQFCGAAAAQKPLSRTELDGMLKACGGAIAGTVSKDVRALVTGGASSQIKESSKTAAAAKLGVDVLTEGELFELMFTPLDEPRGL
jgi:NAD-dependent DNA ligase